MTITIDATYEGGVLKPNQPLPLREHEIVRVTVEQGSTAAAPSATSVDSPGTSGMTLAERIAARAQALPPGALDNLPDDLAAQHDHYLYGTPKR